MKKYMAVGLVLGIMGYVGCIQAMDGADAAMQEIAVKHVPASRRSSVACKRRSSKSRLIRALSAGAHVGVTCDNRLTNLHCAAKEGSIETVQRLLARKAAPDTQSARGYTSLHYAVLGDKPDGVVEVLLCSGAKSGLRDNAGRTPLHMAVFSRKEEAVRSLLAHRANVDAQDSLGNTPLHDLARQARSDCADLVRLLLRCGANDTIINRDGQTPLVVASQAGNLASMRVLLDHKQKREKFCIVS